jgi:dihydrofolate reductase
VPKLTVFLHLTLDGIYAGPRGDLDWFKAVPKDDEFEAYTHGAAQSGNALIFGRATYDMMKSYWPTPDAIASDPDMAKAVNQSRKIVFSKSLKDVAEGPNWRNVTVLREIDPSEILELKTQAKTDFTTLGSGSVVRQLANLGLVDEFDFVVAPIVLGRGKELFEGVGETRLKLLESRSFDNGMTLLRYTPA